MIIEKPGTVQIYSVLYVVL